MKTFTRPLLATLATIVLSVAALHAEPQVEKLGRGLVGIQQADGKVFLSWRLLASDPDGVAFNVYRTSGGGADKTDVGPFGSRQSGAQQGPVKLNERPLTGATWLLDERADLSRETNYVVRPVVSDRELEPSRPFVIAAGAPVRAYLPIAMQTPVGYVPGDMSVGDLDGDGEYELIVHQTGSGRDNSQAGLTDAPILQAYKLDGTLLWTINLGKNIREGAHYTQFLVYDFDGDGRAELVCKTADGTVDGLGKVIGDAQANWVTLDNAATDVKREGTTPRKKVMTGFILRGPEFLTVFDGRTGGALATVPYVPGRHPETENPTPEQLNAVWGDGYGNRVDRFLAGVAYLDGEHPSIVMCRGYYTRTVLAAWDWRDGKLSQRWVFDSDSSEENRKFRGQGNHQLSVADVDGDGRDEIIYGAMVVDDDGKILYSTGWGHGDALHVSDLDPTNPGLEVFDIQERFDQQGMSLRDAKTGRPIYTIPSVKAADAGGDKGEGPGRGVCFNIDPRHPGNEAWAAGAGMTGLYNAKGERIGEKRPRSCNFAVWWDGDLLREILDRNYITKWNWADSTETPLLLAQGCTSNNGTKATPALSGDLLGDWREEVIWRTLDGKELRIYTTTIPTPHRITTLMQDPQYRVAIAWQNVAYNQPPHPSFYLDETAPLPARPKVKIIGNK